MSITFPEPISNLPKADIPIEGLKAFLSQGEGHQILFMEFSEDIEVPEHTHESQWGVVLEGESELTIDRIPHVFKKGDSYFIPTGTPHSAKIYAGYADVTFFDQSDRYKVIEKT